MGEPNTAHSALSPVAPATPFLSSPYDSFQKLVQHRHLVFGLVQRTLRNRYRTAGLGYVWLVLEPLMLAITYWFLFVMLAGNPDEMYPVWVLIGIIVWGTFGKSLTGSVTSISSNSQMINMAYFPRIIFPFSSALSNIITSLGSSLVLIPIIFYFDTPITLHLLWVPLGIIMAGLMGGSFGLFFAPMNCKQRDVEHLFRFIVRAGFFFSPVMWTAEMALERGNLGGMALWNPMATPITMVRHAIEGHALGLPFGVVAASVLFLVACLIFGSMIFAMSERKAVKYL
ncbi:ABC transporter permease [Candidatus Poseidoniaceae archaeon]|nr:ABC transporter permease [Candidatus Poseidoniaceae archaeon]